jgi:hypothetical protein
MGRVSPSFREPGDVHTTENPDGANDATQESTPSVGGGETQGTAYASPASGPTRHHTVDSDTPQLAYKCPKTAANVIRGQQKQIEQLHKQLAVQESTSRELQMKVQQQAQQISGRMEGICLVRVASEKFPHEVVVREREVDADAHVPGANVAEVGSKRKASSLVSASDALDRMDDLDRSTLIDDDRSDEISSFRLDDEVEEGGSATDSKVVKYVTTEAHTIRNNKIELNFELVSTEGVPVKADSINTTEPHMGLKFELQLRTDEPDFHMDPEESMRFSNPDSHEVNVLSNSFAFTFRITQLNHLLIHKKSAFRLRVVCVTPGFEHLEWTSIPFMNMSRRDKNRARVGVGVVDGKSLAARSIPPL